MRLATFNSLTQIRFSLFGLPFTLAGALLAAQLPPMILWLWILVGFMAARTAGMAFNQLIDRRIDGRNPRTDGRVLARREVPVWQVATIAWGSLALFILVCAQINGVVFALSPLAAILIWGYSYTKRFTVLCHLVLGLVQFLGPVMAYAAVAGRIDWAPVVLGSVCFACIAGNDIIYALQDLDFDRKEGLKSLPAWLGEKRAVWLAHAMHAGALKGLVVLGVIARLSIVYWAGVVFAGWILLRRGGSPATFGRSNALVSASVFLGILGDLVWHALL